MNNLNYRKLTDIVVDQERLRKDMSELELLIDSIERNQVDLASTRGLMHPVVIDANNNLIAGGRRFASFNTLSKLDKVVTMPNGDSMPYSQYYSIIPVTELESLSPAKRRMLELDENLKRKSMTWQENMFGIVDYHRLATKEALTDHLRWSQDATSEILGVPQSSVSTAIKVAKHMVKNKDSALWKASSMFEAVQLLVAGERDEAAKEQLSRINSKRALTAKNVDLAAATVTVTTVDPIKINLPAAKRDQPLLSVTDISKLYYHGDCLKLIPQIASSGKISHFVCDPPYGINTDNLAAAPGKIERIAETHIVADNVQLLQEFLFVSFNNVAEDGFLCMWYDLDHHEKLQEWATKIGWRVTRWPLTWCKTSPCSNSQAQYNITKATEVCMIMRKSEKSILRTKQNKNWVCCDSVSSASHPFVKPPEVWDYLIDAVSQEGDIMVDPFAGEGSFLAQAFKRKRVPFGIEIDETHIANGLNYIQERLGKKGVSEGLLSELPL